MTNNHIQLADLPYSKPVKEFLSKRYGENHAARYHFTQCPYAEFAKKHNLLHVLPLMCNCDFFGIEQLHGTLIRCGTCGNSDICDYCVVGDKNPLADRYEIKTDDSGFLVSVEKER